MRIFGRTSSILRISSTRPSHFNASRSSIASIQSKRIWTLRTRASNSNSKVKRKVQAANMSECTQSQACCNTPAVVGKGYSAKGDYIQVDGLKTCTYRSHKDLPNLTSDRRCNGFQGCKAGHPHRLRHLWLLRPNHPRCRYSCIHRQGSPVPGLHARFL